MTPLASLWLPILVAALGVFIASIDGLAYGAVTGGVFAWLWPQ